MHVSRRSFLRGTTAFSLGFVGLRHALARRDTLNSAVGADSSVGYGPLVADPKGVLDLPAGFTYRTFSPRGEEMNDGLLVPGKHDGMACFAAGTGKVALVRNHELLPIWTNKGPFGTFNERLGKVDPKKLFDAGGGGRPGLGGTTTLIYNLKDQRVERQFMSLLGTVYNCAGGPTPWGSWLTCEETTIGRKDEGLDQDHGWVFEVDANATGPVDPVPLTAMGRFKHEAVAVDPSGVVYLTEDLADGVLYRFIPRTPGKLAAGGRLQALVVRDQRTLDTKNWGDVAQVTPGSRLSVGWVDLEDVLSPNDDLRVQGASKGAALFARCEGMWHAGDSVYFAATTGGKKQFGQIWKYTPSASEGTPGEDKDPATLELFLEPNNSDVLNNADNVTTTPWGDLLICEDGANRNGLVCVTPKGDVYRFGMNRLSDAETAGACFSPDGSTLFFNVQEPGITFAVTGPWKKS